MIERDFRPAAILLFAPLILTGCNMFARLKPSEKTAEKFLTEMQAGRGDGGWITQLRRNRNDLAHKEILGLFGVANESPSGASPRETTGWRLK